jgi:hypothetical protein
MTRLAVLLALLALAAPVLADTGTYEIPDYRVTLVPREDGRVEITYRQTWKVTGGKIPWVTVGTPNSGFEIVDGSGHGAARRVRGASSGDWAGVRIDLDREYRAGETFEVGFAVVQRGMFHARGDTYLLDFVPGWYDRGRIGELTITLEFFADLADAVPTPEPSVAEPRRLVWSRTDIHAGGKVHVSVEFPKEVFPDGIASDVAVRKRIAPSSKVLGIILIVVIFAGIIALLGVFGRRGGPKGRYGSGGSVGLGSSHVRGTGCVVSCACACACVSCACACACAGGGAAGCDRKLLATCPLCADCDREDCHVRSSSFPGRGVV